MVEQMKRTLMEVSKIKGLHFNEGEFIATGTIDGYNIDITRCHRYKGNIYYNVFLFLSNNNKSYMQHMISQFNEKPSKSNHNFLEFSVAVGISQEKDVQNILNEIEKIVNILKANAITNGCQVCKKAKQTKTYCKNTCTLHLCSDCVTEFKNTGKFSNTPAKSPKALPSLILLLVFIVGSVIVDIFFIDIYNHKYVLAIALPILACSIYASIKNHKYKHLLLDYTDDTWSHRFNSK